MDRQAVPMMLTPTRRAQTVDAVAPRMLAVSGMPNPIPQPVITRILKPLATFAPALPDEALVHERATLAAVRLRGGSALLEEQARDALLAGLEARGLRAAILTTDRSSESGSPRTATPCQRFSLDDLAQTAGPVCDVFIVAGYDHLPLPSVVVRPAEDDQRCALYEVHVSDAPERISVRCNGDLSRHADELVDWILATAA